MIFLKSKWPIPLKISLGIAAVPFVLIISIIPGYQGDLIDPIGSVILGLVIGSWWFFEHSGYKFGYSDDGICSRMPGLVWSPLPRRLPFARIKFSEMVKIKKVFQGNERAKRNFFPYDYLGIEGSNGETAVLYPDGMRHEDFCAMLELIYEKRPDLFVKKWQKDVVKVK